MARAKVVKEEARVLKEGKNKMKCAHKDCGTSGCTYFLAGLGTAIYYISTTTGFWAGMFGVLKGFVWPAFLVFELFKFLVG